MKIKLITIDCKRCGHIWTPRYETVTICPKCKSKYFYKEKESKNGRRSGISKT